MMRNYARPLILVLAAVALVASVSSLYVHYQMLQDPLYSSFCDISDTISCETVYASQYGTFFGVPVAAGGAIWSSLVLLLGLTGLKGRRSEQTQVVLGYIFLLSLVGVAAVLYFAYASFVIIGVTCPLCVAVYISVTSILLVSGSVSSTPMATLFSRLGRNLQAVRRDSVGQTVAVVWLAASVALVALFPREPLGVSAEAGGVSGDVTAVPALTETLTDTERGQFELWINAQLREDIPVPPEAEGAVVVIQKFNDYICPACRQTYVEYQSVVVKYLQSHPEEVRFVTRDFPLEAECNVGALHLAACEAAAAVRMAKAVGRGAEMEAWLFANQASMSPDQVKEGLEQIAQVTDFDEQYQTILEAVRADAQLGNRLNIQSTPTFFVNGIRIAGGLRPVYMDALITAELERAAAAGPPTG
jgi:uncharacterized membrane protein